jgi:hypothetical protein
MHAKKGPMARGGSRSDLHELRRPPAKVHPSPKRGTARISRKLLLAMLVIPLLAGCLDMRPLPTATPTSPPTTSTPPFVIPTLIPTSTWIPAAHPSPAFDLGGLLGEIIFQDDFKQNLGWRLEEDIFGATALVSGRLTLASRRQGVWRFAYSPVVNATDFYMQVDLRAEICGPGDEFGIMYRANPSVGSYRFGLRCEGGVRVTRIVGETALSLITRAQTETVVPGPPAQNQLGVWARGSQFRFYINRIEAFTARDSTYFQGAVGFYIFSGDAGQTTVSFDDLVVRNLLITPIQTATPTLPEGFDGS